MQSVVSICNIALARLGDSATVASIDPPEGSAQAEHCARFYPLALQTLLESHPWNFATRRIKPALLYNRQEGWEYAYALPVDALVILSVLPKGSTDDYENLGIRVPVEYQLERNNNASVLLTDTPDITVRYISTATDPALYPANFVEALSWKLAALLAGPLLKGDAALKTGQACEEMAAHFLSAARVSDSNQRLTRVTHTPTWIRAR
ncbi:MAG: hypothetical protein Q4A74_01635 [Cardiobacteriaceae bacterium]|nr:hypothetical protein [Cardiobacteriaceae bacterium]